MNEIWNLGEISYNELSDEDKQRIEDIISKHFDNQQVSDLFSDCDIEDEETDGNLLIEDVKTNIGGVECNADIYYDYSAIRRGQFVNYGSYYDEPTASDGYISRQKLDVNYIYLKSNNAELIVKAS